VKKSFAFIAALTLAGSLSVALPVLAEPSQEQIEALEQRIEKLEALIRETGGQVPGEEAPARQHEGAQIAFSGALEAEASFGSNKQTAGGRVKSSDIVLATVELGWEVALNDRFGGNLVLLWEEDDTEPIAVDEGVITWQGDGFEVTAGRFYPPFGTFNSHFISDPLTLELGETQESGIMIHAAPEESFAFSVTAANGGSDKASSGDHVNDFGLRLDFHPVLSGEDTLNIGLQYYSDIADTDADILGGAAPGKTVGGFAANIDWVSGPWSFIAEYLGASGSFNAADLDADGDGAGDKPAAWNVELGHSLSETQTLALRYEGSSEFFDFPKSQYGIVSSWDLGDGVSLGVEYMHGNMDSAFSSGDSKRDAFTTQLAVDF
jgi:hypothetical protein